MLVFSDTAHTRQLLQAPAKLKQGTALYGGDNGYAAQARCPGRLDPNEFGQVKLDIKPLERPATTDPSAWTMVHTGCGGRVEKRKRNRGGAACKCARLCPQSLEAKGPRMPCAWNLQIT